MATEKQPAIKLMNVVNTMKLGFGAMIAQGPVLNGLNNFVSIAAKYNVTAKQAIKMNYQGVEGAPLNRYMNIFRSLKAHYAKEGVRNCYRVIVLSEIDPILKENLSETQAAFAFSGILAVLEMACANPADSVRVQRQGGGKVSYSLRSLYSGMWGNGVRQFGTWGIFKAVGIGCNKYLPYVGVDPHSYVGIGVKSAATGFALNAIYPFEYVKMRLQHQQTQQPAKPIVIGSSSGFWKPRSVYLNTVISIIEQHGWKAFFNGATPKTVYNFLLALNAFYFNERNLRRSRDVDEETEATSHKHISHTGT